MPSGLRETTKPHFEIYYEAPWGGVASDMAPMDIAPNQLVECDGVTIRNGILCSTIITKSPTNVVLTLIPPSGFPNAYICLIFNCANFLCAVDQYGFSYIATVQGDGTIKFQQDQEAPGAGGSFGVPTAVQVAAGVAYISVYSTHTLYAYTPTVGYVVASTITAGQFISTFNEYMLQFNTNTGEFASGGTPLGEQPCAVNWSGPDEFTTWDPSVNELAGYQVLTSIEDYISGFVAADNVGYIFKREGVTQMTATGIAIAPWTFTTYWNSVAGQGLIFPESLKQFGRIIFLATDSDVYRFYGGVFTPIAEPARAAIYTSFQQAPSSTAIPNTLIAGGFSIYPFNDEVPIAEYMFMAIDNYYEYPELRALTVWFYQPDSKTWTSVTTTAYALLLQYVPTAINPAVNWIKTASVFLNYVSTGSIQNVTNQNVNLIYINYTYSVNGTSYTQTFVFFNLVSSQTASLTGLSNNGACTLTFRQEEIKLGRRPTIRRVIIKACGVGNLFPTVSGVSFGIITLDGTNVPKTYYSNQGIYTGEDPQLTIESIDFLGQITKVMMAGTYADGDLD
jgi:hypothetical protein